MRHKKRGEYEIFAAILETCIDGANKTRIVYQGNLNFATVNPYLDLLVKNGLVEIVPHDMYKMSIKGKEILEKIRELMKLFGNKANG